MCLFLRIQWAINNGHIMGISQRIYGFGRLKMGESSQSYSHFHSGIAMELVNPGFLWIFWGRGSGPKTSEPQLSRCLDESSFKVSEIGTVPPWKCLLTCFSIPVPSLGPEGIFPGLVIKIGDFFFGSPSCKTKSH